MNGKELREEETADVGIGRRKLSCSRSPPAILPQVEETQGANFSSNQCSWMRNMSTLTTAKSQKRVMWKIQRRNLTLLVTSAVFPAHLPQDHEYSIIMQDRLGKLVPSNAHTRREIVSAFHALLLDRKAFVNFFL